MRASNDGVERHVAPAGASFALALGATDTTGSRVR